MLHSLLIKVSFSCQGNIYDASHEKSTKIVTHAGNVTTRHKKNYLPTSKVIRVVWGGACAFVFCVGPSSDMFLYNDLYMRKMPTKWLVRMMFMRKMKKMTYPSAVINIRGMVRILSSSERRAGVCFFVASLQQFDPCVNTV